MDRYIAYQLVVFGGLLECMGKSPALEIVEVELPYKGFRRFERGSPEVMDIVKSELWEWEMDREKLYTFSLGCHI